MLKGQRQQNLDLLLMRDNSQISTSAGTARAGGDGGNIDINAQLVAATENSDIRANAFEGKGGNIDIDASSVFGFEESDRRRQAPSLQALS